MDNYLQELNRAYDANPGDAALAARLIAALRRLISPNTEIQTYTKRNYPCNITSDDQLWCISGAEYDPVSQTSGGGVLEWCFSQEDAETLLQKMRLDPRFSNLSVRKWHPNCACCGQSRPREKMLQDCSKSLKTERFFCNNTLCWGRC